MSLNFRKKGQQYDADENVPAFKIAAEIWVDTREGLDHTVMAGIVGIVHNYGGEDHPDAGGWESIGESGHWKGYLRVWQFRDEVNWLAAVNEIVATLEHSELTIPIEIANWPEDEETLRELYSPHSMKRHFGPRIMSGPEPEPYDPLIEEE